MVPCLDGVLARFPNGSVRIAQATSDEIFVISLAVLEVLVLDAEISAEHAIERLVFHINLNPQAPPP